MGKPREDRAAAVTHIVDCIAKYGLEDGPTVARERFKEVDHVTWWRWTKQMRADPRVRAKALIVNAVERTPGELLPVPPSAGIVARSPVQARGSFDFMGKFHELYADGEMLREHAITKNPDGSEKIKIANYFASSIKIRSDLMERLIQASQMLYDWDQMKAFYDEIIAVIAEVDPDVAAKIMDRLAELNKKRGFNIAG